MVEKQSGQVYGTYIVGGKINDQCTYVAKTIYIVLAFGKYYMYGVVRLCILALIEVDADSTGSDSRWQLS